MVHKAVSRNTFSRWVKLVGRTSDGIDTEQFGSHSKRAASTSAAARKGVALASHEAETERGPERSCRINTQGS